MIPGPSRTPAPEPDPIPLRSTPKAIPFPTDAFPKAISDMIAEVAENTQTDPAMAGTTALTVLSAAAVGHVGVEAKPGWREVLAIYSATVASPGERKSPVQNTMTAPLHDVEKMLVAQVADERAHAETMQEIAEKRVARVKAEAGNARTRGDQDKLTTEALVAAEEARSIEIPSIPRLIADDATPEAVSSLLAEQGGHLAILSTEGGLFDTMAGRYSNGVANLDVFLKAWSGDRHRVDRRGRDPEFIDRPSLALGLMVQPSVIEAIGRKGDFRGRGLLGRFLYAWPASKVGHRISDVQPVQDATIAAYDALISTLASDLYGTSPEGQILRLAASATRRLVALQDQIEEQLDPDAGLLGQIQDWGNKLVGTIVRIAGLLHLAEHGAAGIRKPISAATFQSAINLGEYYRNEAIHAFAEMGTDQDTADAIYLLERLEKHPGEQITRREMQRLATRFKKAADLDAPVQRLLDTGWLIEGEPVEYSGKGRPPEPPFTLHPKIHSTNLHAAKEAAA